MALTTHLHPKLSLKKSSDVHLLSFWACIFAPRVNFIFNVYLLTVTIAYEEFAACIFAVKIERWRTTT